MIPLSEEALFALYGGYNQALGFVPAIFHALCVVALLLTLSPRPGGNRVIAAILAISWIWTGAVFHIGFFAPLNWGAWIFGAFFIFEGLLLAGTGVLGGRLSFRLEPGPRGLTGLALIAFGLAYPLLDLLTGHPWPRMELPGMLPTPTVLVTAGLLLMAHGRGVLLLTIIPLLWGLVGGSAALSLGIWQDVAMGAATLAAFGIMAVNRLSPR